MYVLCQAGVPVCNDCTVKQSSNSASMAQALSLLAQQKVHAGCHSRSHWSGMPSSTTSHIRGICTSVQYQRSFGRSSQHIIGSIQFHYSVMCFVLH